MSSDVGKTVEDLRLMRAKLVERRVKLAYRLRSVNSGGTLAQLAEINQAIAALDAVIADGHSELPYEPTGKMLFPE
jgi:hypothetical protein